MSGLSLLVSLLQAAAVGLMGRLRAFPAPQDLLCPSERLSCGGSAQSSAAPWGGQCGGARADWAAGLGWAGQNAGELGRAGEGLGWAGKCLAEENTRGELSCGSVQSEGRVLTVQSQASG